MQAQEEIITIKGKRSKRPRLTLAMATSSSSIAEHSGGGFCGDVVLGSSDRVNPTPSNSGDLTHSSVEEEEDMAHCLILLAKGQRQTAAPPVPAATADVNYPCRTCNKSFPSFQALGGHRASHKKPNKTIIPLDEKKISRDHDFQSDGRDDSTILSLQISNRVVLGGGPPNKSSRVHECSICGAEFASGQALGGHMRRHRPIPAVAAAQSSSCHGESQEIKRPRNLLSLDLNLPAPEDDMSESKFPFGPNKQVIVFSASPLILPHKWWSEFRDYRTRFVEEWIGELDSMFDLIACSRSTRGFRVQSSNQARMQNIGGTYTPQAQSAMKRERR
ncbi:hypothetical protein DH2020_026129 [Rehmannia glutinosa]|uniref:C2H2-type domain-containing protein n=1 Tax=Rehmannia glutinosa TaxID=99300 RepID=A0ABR0W0M4_REHGL